MSFRAVETVSSFLRVEASSRRLSSVSRFSRQAWMAGESFSWSWVEVP